MKTEILKAGRLLPVCLLLLFAAVSCVDDNADYGSGGGSGGEKSVTFSLTLPGQHAGGSTYALTTQDEEDVKSVEVLLFASSGNYVETRTVPASAISGTTNVKTFTVKIPEGTYSSLVILANSYDIVFGAGLSASDNKAAALAKLEISNTGKWITDNTSGSYRAIPMWGELPGMTVDQASSSASQITPLTLSLTRMLAKASLELNTAAQGSFKLETIDVYNYYDKGSVTPVAANWSAGIASVPAGAAKPPVTTPYTTLTYQGAEITTADVSCVNEIYLFESDNASQSDLADRTCLVIGGTYTGDGKTYYYRVDFVEKVGGADVYLDIRRNHHYKFKVTSISGPGYDTPDKAFSARPFNIEATVLTWNDTQVTDIVFDGQYMLGVSKGEFSLTREARNAASTDNTLSVTTDVPTGWTVKEITDSNTAGGAPITWLKTDPDPVVGAANATTDIKLVLTENTTGNPRVGYIHLTAGRLTYVVKVTQGTAAAFGIYLTDLSSNAINELLFPASGGTKQFKASWSPDNIESAIAGSQVGTYAFNYGTTGDNLDAMTQTTATFLGHAGWQEFTISPPAITPGEISANPFVEKVSKVDFTIKSGANIASKSIYMRQINYALVTANISSSYMLNGSTYSFNVKSNAAWRIKTVTPTVLSGTGPLLNLQASDNMKVGTTGGYNTSTGEPISFRIVNNLSGLRGTVAVVFESTDSPQKFADVTATLTLSGEYYPDPHSGWAGSNIYYDGSKLTFDDVGVTTHQNYQGVYFKWGSLYGISPAGINYITATTPLYPPAGSTQVGVQWTSIPCISSSISSNPVSPKTWKDRAYLYEIDDYSLSTGDICKYLTEKGWAPAGKKWRMPTANEFETAGDYSSYISGSGTPHAHGTANFSAGYNRIDVSPYAFFPLSSCRDGNGQLYGGGMFGYGAYWASSAPPNNNNAIYFDISMHNGKTVSQAAVRQYGLSVRCVVD